MSVHAIAYRSTLDWFSCVGLRPQTKEQQNCRFLENCILIGLVAL